MEASPPVDDEILVPFLQAADEEECQRLLALLISKHAEPIIQSITKFKLYAHSTTSSGNVLGLDLEDVRADIMVQLISRLRELKNVPHENPISNFRGYVAVISYHACHKYLRRKYPFRHSLKNRLRYLFTHQQGLTLWRGDDRQLYCGLAAWGEQKRPVEGSRLQQLRDAHFTQEQAGLGSPDDPRLNLAALMAGVLRWAGGAVELDDLVKVAAEWTDTRDDLVRSKAGDEEDGDPLERLSDTRAGPETELEQRLYLQRLWTEIQQLPVRQRSALLLNLKDESGDDCSQLFPRRGIATVRQIAQALEMPAERFVELWNDLPLPDSKIAQLLDMTRQQVINLRKCARERLARRMQALEKGR
jgi:RNA polymerase sigma factor (sigma-70 family)